MRIVNAAAPVRVCDLGGWTDTWFSGHGRILNIAVSPHVTVELGVRAGRGTIVVEAESYGDRYELRLGEPPPGRHPLLEAALAEADPPRDVDCHVRIFSGVPGGCATGTSAAVVVALLGALDRLTPGGATAHELAYAAHRVETERLGLQSGIQDQLSAAYGGISLIDMHAYPRASVSEVRLPDAVRWELERRLALVFLGRSRSSSAVHERVIAELEREGEGSDRLEALRRTATAGRDALLQGDLPAFGRAMIDNTEAQERLHPELVGSEARRVIELARGHGAAGWKVNGAGGEGGSVTILCSRHGRDKRALLDAVAAADPGFSLIPIALAPEGLRVWEA